MPAGPTGNRELSEAALQRLMARLGPDPDAAGDRYEELRRTLVKFFDWRGAWAPDECADETIDRLARKLETGENIVDVRAFSYGVARLVLLEDARHPHMRQVALDEPSVARLAEPATAGDAGLLGCVERCLSELPNDARALILRYYADERRAKIDRRADIARQLGLTANALRSRAQRIRDRLERCASECARAKGIDVFSDEGRRSA